MAENTSLQDTIAFLANPKEFQGRLATLEKAQSDAKAATDAAKLATIKVNELNASAAAADAEAKDKLAKLNKQLLDCAAAKAAASDAKAEASAAIASATATRLDFEARSRAVEAERSKLAVAIGDAHNEERKFRDSIASLKACIAGLDI